MTERLFKQLIVALFLMTIFGAGLMTLLNLEALKSSETDHGTGFERETLLSGELARNFEQHYDTEFSLREIGLNTWAAFQFSVFKQAKKGLLIGTDGWLFSDEEFIAHPRGQQSLDANIAYMVDASGQLANKDIALIVVLIPSKARLLQEQVGNHQPALLQQELYPKVLNSLQEQLIPVVDGLQVMSSHPQPESLYLKSDTHWTPAGAGLIASNTAALINQHLPGLSLTPKQFVTENAGESSIAGDLLSFLPLAPFFEHLLPETESIDLFQTYAAEDKALFDNEPLFAEHKGSEVVLLGTSFSADRRWNFDGALKQALSVDLENLAEQGHGPISPMVKFLQLPLPAELKLVIWEIPERYLSMAYPEIESQQVARKSAQKKPMEIK